MTHLGQLLIAFALGGLVAGPMAYRSGMTDGAAAMIRQIHREDRARKQGLR